MIIFFLIWITIKVFVSLDYKQNSSLPHNSPLKTSNDSLKKVLSSDMLGTPALIKVPNSDILGTSALENSSFGNENNIFEKLDFLRFNILLTVLFLIAIFLVILVVPRLGMFILTFGSCFTGFVIFIRNPSTFTFLFTIFTLALGSLLIFLSRDIFTGFITNLERGILTIGKNFIFLFLFFFFIASLNTFLILILKMFFNDIKKNYLTYFLFIFILNWTFNTISYFNIVFVSSLIFKKLNKEKGSIWNSLKVCFSTLSIICYASLLPAFFSSLKVFIEVLQSVLINYKANLIIKIILWLDFFSYILESYNEVIFSYIGMYGDNYFNMVIGDKRILNKTEFIMFRGLKYKNSILKMASVLYITFFFFINYNSLPGIKLQNYDFSLFSYETFEFFYDSHHQIVIVLFLCFNIVNYFIASIEPAFIASYCFRKRKKEKREERKIKMMTKGSESKEIVAGTSSDIKLCEKGNTQEKSICEKGNILEKSNISEKGNTQEKTTSEKSICEKSIADKCRIQEKDSIADKCSIQEKDSIADKCSIQEKDSIADKRSILENTTMTEKSNVTENTTVIDDRGRGKVNLNIAAGILTEISKSYFIF